ncbi:MAG: methyltransferase domain-containing protein [Fimbriimonadaceae bacterium]|nr:methyltransferase domain-containing protein [Fimbriimonadaceae bacterium]
MSRWDPADYRQSSAMQARLAAELLPRLGLQPGLRVLDLGCGDGKVTAELAAAVAPGLVLGCDRSPEMLRFARQAFPAAAVPNLRWSRQDAAALACGPHFDRVVSFACLHWVGDHPAVLRGIGRALRPGGRILLQLGGQGNVDALLPYAYAAMDQPDRRARFRELVLPWNFPPAEPYPGWLTAAGLRPERVEIVPKLARHWGAEGLAGWFRTTWFPLLERLDPDQRGPFIAEICAAYLADHPLRDGWAEVRMQRLEIEARRA